MAYHVAFGKFDSMGNPAPVALNFGKPKNPLTLDAALGLARQFLSEGKPNVSIEDGEGHSVSGDDLVACCNGEKTLTSDLQVISK